MTLVSSSAMNIKDILNSTSNHIIAIDKESRITYCNKRVEEYLELPTEKIIGRKVRDFFPSTGILDVLQDGKPQLGRRLNLKDGTYITNRNPIVVNDELCGAVAVFHNITDLQVLINELHGENERIRELQETLQNILELSTDGVIVVNKNNIITMVNQPFANLLDKKASQLIGRNVYDCYSNAKFPEVMKTGQAEYGYVLDIKGHTIIANRVPIKKDGVITGALGVVAFKDVKDLYNLTEKIDLLQEELTFYKDELDRVCKDKFSMDRIIGESPAFVTLKETIKKVARSNSTVLIRGESGTGKELFAQALHYESIRAQHPFVKVNCAAIPESLLESELFGYSEGAFTGAKKGGQIGKFEMAHNGTIFLDEIGDMSPHMQAKLLRVLQEKTIERLGDNVQRQINVRVVAATNRNLEKLMQANEFREDLYYRLNVVALHIPPLRDRPTDIKHLVHYFITKFNRQFGLKVKTIDAEVLDIFARHKWPGNVRELENAIERSFNMITGDTITKKHLPLYLQEQVNSKRVKDAVVWGLPLAIAQLEREAIIEALTQTKGNRNKAAALLNISRANLFNKLKKYNIQGL